MPNTCFFATRYDLEPVFRAAEAQKLLQYVLCTGYTSYPGCDNPPPIFYRAQDIPTPEFEDSLWLILERETKFTVQPKEKRSEEEEPKYQIILESDNPNFLLSACRLSEEQYLEMGDISIPGRRFEFYTPETYALYRLFASALCAQLQRIGFGYLYGEEALQLGKQGVKYVSDSVGSYIVSHISTYEDIEEVQQVDEELAAIPRETRLSLEKTWAYLKLAEHEPPEDKRGRPIIPKRSAGSYNSGPCLGFYRTRVYAEDFHNLTMPRTFFARTELERVLFRGSDLSASFMCWDDWLDCDFTEADLSGADMRASLYINCTFAHANLTGADLRSSSFVDCAFTNAQMQGSKMTKAQAADMLLSDAQRAEIVWKRTDGPAPNWD
jgi:hypothetical protein